MADKGKGKRKAPVKGSSNAHQQDLKTEDVLQALILADSFDQRFTPITLEKPRVLIKKIYLINLYFFFLIV